MLISSLESKKKIKNEKFPIAVAFQKRLFIPFQLNNKQLNIYIYIYIKHELKEI